MNEGLAKDKMSTGLACFDGLKQSSSILAPSSGSIISPLGTVKPPWTFIDSRFEGVGFALA
jgi:hypothetical protein